MPRLARIKSETDIYHVMMRGIDKQKIFIDDEDNERFIFTLGRYRQKSGYELYAYCLMGNHVHLLIKEGLEPLSTSMKRIGTSYVSWYNWQYDRKGHLFQDRYKSEPVEDDSYFLTVLRYIHQNPLKVGLVDSIESYRWSSYKEYVTDARIVSVDYVLSMFAGDKEKSLERFKDFNMVATSDKCLEYSGEKKTISDKKIKQLVLNKYSINLALLKSEELDLQLKIVKYLKDLDGTSLRQLSRLTGFTVDRIYRL